MRKRNLFWKIFGVLGIIAAGFFAALSFSLKEQNDKYRDALIDLSENL